MTISLYIDFETYCETPITYGTHRYAERAEIMLFAWAVDEGPVSVWDLTTGAPMPAALEAAIMDADEVWAHNSHFDRTVARHAMPSLLKSLPLPMWRDTMVQALTHGLPGKLETLCEVLNLPTDKSKDKAGKQLIQLFCKPRPFSHKKTHEMFPGETVKAQRAALKAWVEQARKDWNGRATGATHPIEWARFISYAGDDIVAMREVRRRLPVWNYKGTELALWHLDQAINDRGVAIDLELAEAAVAAVALAQKGLAKRTVEMTDGEVQAATQVKLLIAHVLQQFGIDLPDMQKATIERRIEDPDLPEGLRELLRIRLQASSTSTSKYETLMRGTSSDGRLRGTLQFCGASRTGRWAGRLFQPQNLPSRGLLPREQIESGIEALKAGCADLIVDNVMHLTSSAIRGCLVAPKGRKLVIADLSNIEGRDQAWLAGERWKLKAFRAFDAGTGPDLYKLAYGNSFGVAPEDVTKDQRQVGKVQELALGYEGGVGAFVTFAATYGIDLDELAEKAVGAIPGNIWGQANIMLDWHRKKLKKDPANALGMAERTWLVCESFKLGWRDAHPAISGYWKELGNVVREAIENPGNTFPCRTLKVRRDGAWLRIVLPSGRALCYPSPQIQGDKITYMGVNQYSRKWSRLQTYGGKLFENVCQAVARDVMTHNMPAIEAAGYQICLTVHDEVICETPDEDDFNEDHLASLLAANPPWAPDMPLAAAGFQTTRYRKD